MSHIVRASKYRHVYADAPKQSDRWENIRLSTSNGEGNFIKANTKFVAVPLAGGGGPVGIFELNGGGGKISPTHPSLSCHKSPVLDFDFNPFHEHMIATGSEDQTVKVIGIPPDGMTDHVTEPLVDLQGHMKKVTLLKWHPTAQNIIASVSADHTVKVWDVESGDSGAICTDDSNEALRQDINWNHTGSVYATSCRDKAVRIFDPREGATVAEILNVHEGARSTKLTYLGSRGTLLTVGFTKQSHRQIKIWDPRNLEQPIKTEAVDQGTGTMIPHFDEDTNILYLAGKGDGNIRYYEVIDENPHIFKLSEYRTNVPAKGVAFVPKRGLKHMKCETMRILKLTSNAIEPLSFTVPRKSEAFQEDLFPPTFAGLPAMSSAEWLDGLDKECPKMSLNPADNGSIAVASEEIQSDVKPKTRSQLQKELNEMIEYNELLIKVITDAGITVPEKGTTIIPSEESTEVLPPPPPPKSDEQDEA